MQRVRPTKGMKKAPPTTAAIRADPLRSRLITPNEDFVAIEREYGSSVTISHMGHVLGLLLQRRPEAGRLRGVDLLILAGNDGVSRALIAMADGYAHGGPGTEHGA